MILETVDLHFPEGWSPKEYNKFNDLRDPIAYVDNRLANFVSQFKRINDPNTVLLILGDHNFMGVSKIIYIKSERTIFNAIYNSQRKVPKNKLKETVSALDIAPTILDLCGASWNREQFGLGISLFSDKKSLMEQYGEEEFNNKKKQNSKFYDKLF